MNNATTMFLVKLSHQWDGYVLMTTGALALATYTARRIRGRYQFQFDPRLKLATAASWILGSLTFLNSIVLVVAIAHFGCAALVAQQHLCNSNLRLLGQAELMYAEDYDEHFPPAAHWTDLIQPDVKKANQGSDKDQEGPSVFQCPSADSGPSYATNAKIGGLHIADLDDSADTVLLFDADLHGIKSPPTTSLSGGEELLAKTRHSEPNIAFCDGHVKWQNLDSLGKLEWEPKQLQNTFRSGN